MQSGDTKSLGIFLKRANQVNKIIKQIVTNGEIVLNGKRVNKKWESLEGFAKALIGVF